MSKENTNNLLKFLENIDKKIFNDVKNLSSIDQNILSKFISLKENLQNLENLENLENFKTIINQIANETNQTSEIILNRLQKFRILKLI